MTDLRVITTNGTGAILEEAVVRADAVPAQQRIDRLQAHPVRERRDDLVRAQARTGL